MQTRVKEWPSANSARALTQTFLLSEGARVSGAALGGQVHPTFAPVVELAEVHQRVPLVEHLQ